MSIEGDPVMRALRNGVGPQMAYWGRRTDEHDRPWTAGKESGQWLPDPLFVALVAVAEAARGMVRADATGPFSYEAHVRLKAALDDLTEAQTGVA